MFSSKNRKIPRYNSSKDDIKEFENIFNYYFDKVRKYAFGITKDGSVAEEIAQNVLLKLWLKRREIDWTGNISGYVFAISKNEINYHFRLKSKLARYSRIDIIQQYKDEVMADDPILLREINANLKVCLKNMPEQRRKIFAMSRIEMLSNEEIAQKLGLSKRTVETHISLAIKTLRKNLGNFGFWVFLYFV